MVVLSAAICTKNGKTLVARQFVEMTRIRIEGLLAAFPKLMGSNSKQHTYIETESVRYIYHPMESLYLLIVTNRASNIVEDLETLRLLSKVIPDIAGATSNLSEDRVVDKAYELIFAFDEVITAGGYREPVTIQQIRTNMEMESHEEKLHLMIKTSKMESARDQAKEAAKTIMDRKRMEGIGGGAPGPSAGGMGSGSYGSSGRDSYEPAAPAPVVQAPVVPAVVHAPVKGLSIGGLKGAKNDSLFDALVKEEKLNPALAAKKASNSAAAVEEPQSAIVQHPVMLSSMEKISAELTRDGDVTNVEVKGNLTLTAADDDAACCAIQLALDGSSAGFTFNTHPKVNKQLYERNQVLIMKDTSKGFPAGRAVGILRWSNSQSSGDFIPLTVNCWPEEESKNKMLVTIDYSASNKFNLHNVKIRIPVLSMDAPCINTIDGNYTHDKANNCLIWEIDMIDSSNSSGNLEFTIAEKDADSFFPINISFSSQQMQCNVDVVSVKAIPAGAALDGASGNIVFGYSKGMSTDEYVIA
jgi:coatomer subunit delta